jgi:hypothetical protein
VDVFSNIEPLVFNDTRQKAPSHATVSSSHRRNFLPIVIDPRTRTAIHVQLHGSSKEGKQYYSELDHPVPRVPAESPHYDCRTCIVTPLFGAPLTLRSGPCTELSIFL